jgi:allantoate deiminase
VCSRRSPSDDGAVTGRIFERLAALYAIGATRIGYSPEEDAAHELASGWMREAGLEVEADGAGNLFGRREVARVWSGSHLDTVPNGGRFDGALGVVAAIEVAERRPDLPLGVVVFRDEERGCAGSRAAEPRPGPFVELHIEQGPRLAAAGAPLAVVTSIVAHARRRLVFEGRAGHAGTTPMEGREDALCAAAEFVLRAREAARAIEGAVATVGWLEVEPGGMNVIPGRVTLTVDARAPDDERLTQLLEALDLEPEPRTPAAHMSERVRAVLREEIGPSALELPSGAGHDAGIFAAAGVEAGMLFVRSLNGGVSHSPDELSSAEDIALAIDVLERALVRLSQ